MSVQFVIGRAGTGKTHRCFSQIVDALSRDPLGPPIYWIVPKQATFMAERRLTCGSKLKGFCRARVVSFELLGEEILAECGGGAVPQVTSTGRQMLLGHLLRTNEPNLQFFNAVARRAGLAAELDATFAEFERCGKGVEDLQTLLSDLETNTSHDPQSKSLLAKFHDLHLLYDAYAKYLGKDQLDQHRRLAQVLKSVEHCRLIQNADVYVDDFREFNDFERQTLAGVAKVCRRMEINIQMDPASDLVADANRIPAEMNLFHRTEEAYRKLWFTFHEQGIKIDPPILLKETQRFTNPYISHVEKHLFSPRPAIAQKANGIDLIVATDRRSEVDAAARKIQEWLLAGMRLREIVVLARSIDDYNELIDASFREHGIDYFIDRRAAAAHHPLPQVVRSLLLLALHHWPNEAVMTLAKSGLCGMSLSDADELENYVLLHRIRGAAWADETPWKYHRDKTRDSEADLPPAQRFELQRIDALRRQLIDPLRPFVAANQANASRKICEYITDLFRVLERFGVRKTMGKWIDEAAKAGNIQQQEEHQAVWSELMKLLDQMTDVMGDEPVSPEDFLSILEAGLEQFDLGLTPPTLDQVLVGGIERTRTGDVRAAILLGMNEGEFPRVPRETTIFSDGERRALVKRKIELDPDGERKLLDESLLGYVAFTRASERLCITRSAADNSGRPQMPSLFFRRLKAMLPDVEAEVLRADDRDSAATIGTPRQLVTRLMRWVRTPSTGTPVAAEIAGWKGGGEGSPSFAIEKQRKPKTLTPALSRSTGRGGNADTFPALYHWLATHDCCDDAIDVMRYRAWRALKYDNLAQLSPDIAAQLFASPLSASVSRIETFATCPFKHFARYGLHLEQREDADVTAIDLGVVYHGILENLVKEMVVSHQTWGANPKNVTAAAISGYAKQIGESLRGELMLSSARNQYLLQHVEKTLGQVIDAQEAAARRGRFTPLRAELEFGSPRRGSLPAFELRTPQNNSLKLNGKIDRVDVIADQAAFAVIDYKLSGSSLSLDRVYHGLSLQLLTYLLVLQANGDQLAGQKLTPAAAFYVKLLRQLDDVKHPDDATPPEDESFDLQIKPRGLINRDFLNAIDANLAPGVRSDVIQAAINKDGSIGFKRNSDAAEADEFAALLLHVKKRIAELGDQIIAGKIDVMPYRMGLTTPCPNCEYRPVCRFDTLTNRYHNLSVLGRELVLQKITDEMSGEVSDAG